MNQKRIHQTTHELACPQDLTLTCTLIRAGRSKNGLDWPAATLQQAASLFNGAPALVDHRNTPTVDATIGSWANCTYQDGAITGELHILEHQRRYFDLAREIIQRRQQNIPAPDIGISVDVTVAYTNQDNQPTATRIIQVHSADLVVAPAAGGTLHHAQEQENDTMNTHTEQTNNRPDTTETIRALQEARQRAEHEIKLAQCTLALEQTLANPDLPSPVKDRIRARFAGRTFTTDELDTAIREEQEYAAAIAALAAGGQPKKPDTPTPTEWHHARISLGLAPQDTIRAAAYRLFDIPKDKWDPDLQRAHDRLQNGAVPPFSGLREMYVYFTADHAITGNFFARSREAAMVGSDLPNVLSDSINKRLQTDYEMYPQDWRLWTTVTSLKSLENHYSTQLLELGSLPSVAEGAAYSAVSITDYKATLSPKKYGETVVVTREMILRDDLGALRRIITKLANAAGHTIADTVFGLVEDNTTIYDSKALFLSTSDRGAASVGNVISGALASATLAHGLQILRNVRGGASTSVPIIFRRFYLIVPPALELTAAMLCGDQYMAAGTHGDQPTSGYSYFRDRIVNYIVSPWNSSATKYWLVGDPRDCEGLEVGFVNGIDRPTLLMQDDPRVGTVFTNDQISYKVRLEFGAAIVNWRPFAGYMT